MHKALAAIAGLIMGYLAGAVGGALLVDVFSGNTHDLALEAVMTGAFVTGPVGAAFGMTAALFWARRTR
ncbi:hypothetical protein [Methylocystis echinoides]|uniref:hypothetical protein n=1 Tax=Methylocystis echinoides TaxID=29468 RepID=UPI00343E3724